MSSKVERERRKAQLLSQIQQQRWIFPPVVVNGWNNSAYDRRWNMLRVAPGRWLAVA
ncbi:hypothetical protein GCM10029976_003640 [Kribbella albertanoniae]